MKPINWFYSFLGIPILKNGRALHYIFFCHLLKQKKDTAAIANAKTKSNNLLSVRAKSKTQLRL